MTKVTKVLALYDSHYPHTISLRQFCNYAKYIKPDVFILGGDNWSLDIIAHWNDSNFKNIGFDNIKKQLRDEAVGFGNQLDELKKAMPRTKFLYLVGNHEDWIEQFTSKYPQMDDLSLSGLLGLKKRNVEVCKFGKAYKVGKLYFVHGHQYGSDNPAKQAVVRAHHTIVLGHHHSHKVWTDYSDLVESDRYVGYLVPCYCKRSPDYLKGRPNAWANGFFWANVKPSGNFCAGVQLVSPEGNFITQQGNEYC